MEWKEDFQEKEHPSPFFEQPPSPHNLLTDRLGGARFLFVCSEYNMFIGGNIFNGGGNVLRSIVVDLPVLSLEGGDAHLRDVPLLHPLTPIFLLGAFSSFAKEVRRERRADLFPKSTNHRGVTSLASLPHPRRTKDEDAEEEEGTNWRRGKRERGKMADRLSILFGLSVGDKFA
ncbi:hypothetical protein CDAR_41011 [Caerostris darwini]|uniref:Uncharacterized protein n=1 Tax=Caerostris darwini TaxID=1538125 RepID=A0AAV4VF06_9ARAC|nr:hypothetical protein CDAR_41011 [Caerostris darwini]